MKRLPFRNQQKALVEAPPSKEGRHAKQERPRRAPHEKKGVPLENPVEQVERYQPDQANPRIPDHWRYSGVIFPNMDGTSPIAGITVLGSLFVGALKAVAPILVFFLVIAALANAHADGSHEDHHHYVCVRHVHLGAGCGYRVSAVSPSSSRFRALRLPRRRLLRALPRFLRRCS